MNKQILKDSVIMHNADGGTSHIPSDSRFFTTSTTMGWSSDKNVGVITNITSFAALALYTLGGESIYSPKSTKKAFDFSSFQRKDGLEIFTLTSDISNLETIPGFDENDPAYTTMNLMSVVERCIWDLRDAEDTASFLEVSENFDVHLASLVRSYDNCRQASVIVSTMTGGDWNPLLEQACYGLPLSIDLFIRAAINEYNFAAWKVFGPSLSSRRDATNLNATREALEELEPCGDSLLEYDRPLFDIVPYGVDEDGNDVHRRVVRLTGNQEYGAEQLLGIIEQVMYRVNTFASLKVGETIFQSFNSESDLAGTIRHHVWEFEYQRREADAFDGQYLELTVTVSSEASSDDAAEPGVNYPEETPAATGKSFTFTVSASDQPEYVYGFENTGFSEAVLHGGFVLPENAQVPDSFTPSAANNVFDGEEDAIITNEADAIFDTFALEIGMIIERFTDYKAEDFVDALNAFMEASSEDCEAERDKVVDMLGDVYGHIWNDVAARSKTIPEPEEPELGEDVASRLSAMMASMILNEKSRLAN